MATDIIPDNIQVLYRLNRAVAVLRGQIELGMFAGADNPLVTGMSQTAELVANDLESLADEIDRAFIRKEA